MDDAAGTPRECAPLPTPTQKIGPPRFCPGRMFRLLAAVLTFSLGAAVLIDLARERIERFTLRADFAERLVAHNELRSANALRIALEAERAGDVRKAETYYDEADGRSKLAEYHRDLSRLYLTEGVRFWRPEPVDPQPPTVRLIPERMPGMGPRLAGRAAGSGPAP